MRHGRWTLPAIILGLAFWIVMGWFVWTMATDAVDCEPEPASQWAPAGWVCPPIYGDGDASRWPGPGVARNDCVWPWQACEPIAITSLKTGLTIQVQPTMWCMCWVGVSGPSGETARIVDLDPASVAALGLDWDEGLFKVRVEPAVWYAEPEPAGAGTPLVPPPSVPPSPTDGAAPPGQSPQALPNTAMAPDA